MFAVWNSGISHCQVDGFDALAVEIKMDQLKSEIQILGQFSLHSFKCVFRALVVYYFSIFLSKIFRKSSKSGPSGADPSALVNDTIDDEEDVLRIHHFDF